MSATEGNRVAVYGATGVTGRLVARALARRGLAMRLAARSLARLSALEAELLRDWPQAQIALTPATVEHPSAIDAVLDDAGVLISCAGPFIELGPPVARAAIRRGVHYLDTTGEQVYMSWLLRHLHDQAVARGVVLAPAMAYEYALGDCVAAVVSKALGARHLGICYASRAMSTSQGTKKSMMRVAARQGLAWRRGQLTPQRAASRLFSLQFPDGVMRRAFWIPGGEALTVPRHCDALTVETCMAVRPALGSAMQALSPWLGAMLPPFQPLADRLIDRLDAPPTSPRKPAAFDVIAFDPDSGEPLWSISGEEPYAMSARVAVEAASRLLSARPACVGFTSAAALFDPREFLSAVGARSSHTL